MQAGADARAGAEWHWIRNTNVILLTSGDPRAGIEWHWILNTNAILLTSGETEGGAALRSTVPGIGF